MDDLAAYYSDIAHPESMKKVVFGLLLDDKCMGEIRSAMEALNKVDLGLAYTSQKLMNLENLLLHVVACENDFEAVSTEDDKFPQDFVEKALTLDLLHAILITEIQDLDNFISSLQALTVDASNNIFSCEYSMQLYNVMGDKLHESEELLKQLHERIIEMKMQLAKLQMTSLTLNHSEWKYNMGVGFSQHVQGSSIHLKGQMQTVSRRHILRMLEKSLARELDLEKKLSELRQNEDGLKQKLYLTEQIGMCMEEAAEVTWGRFLEADNTAEVLMGISKEMLDAKETEIQKINRSIKQIVADNSEVYTLREKVKLLEEKLRKSDSQLKEAYASNEASQSQVREMDEDVQSLKESIHEAESRAQDAESRIAQLTVTNMELTEELEFLKGLNDINAEKSSLLEKQLREAELQLQHARASSEVSQEQQNMLYSAIWDMETLIDELKQKASKAEIKIEKLEEQCMLLSGTNLELNKELDFQRAQGEFLEASLNEATVEKIASAKHIDIRTNLIMDMVMDLAIQRERIQNQMYSLTKENKVLKEKLQKPKNASADFLDNEGADFPPSKLN